MTTRRLQQVHPRGTGTGDESPALDSMPNLRIIDATGNPDINIIASSSDHWEGHVRLDDVRAVPFMVYRDKQQVLVWIAGESYIFGSAAPATRTGRLGREASDDIVCPVPGVVIAVHVTVDDIVEAGQDLVIVESMKTEQVIKSPRDGTVQRVPVQGGDRVDRGMRLVVLFPIDED